MQGLLSNVAKAPAVTRAQRWFVALVLLLFLGLTGGVVSSLRKAEHDQAAARFERAGEVLAADVRRGLEQGGEALRALRALHAAYGGKVPLDSFRAHMSARRLDEEFPGLLGVGVLDRVSEASFQAYEQARRAEGQSSYAVLPAERPGAEAPWVVRMVEPLVPNRAWLGRRMSDDVVRLEAMKKAISSGRLSLGGTLLSGDETPDRSGRVADPGFVLFLSASAGERGGPPTLLFARLNLARTLAQTLERSEYGLDFELFDGPDAVTRALVFDHDDHIKKQGIAVSDRGDGRLFVGTKALEVGGRVLTLRWSSTAEFDATVHGRTPWVVGAVGVVLSAAIAGWAFVLLRARALAQARVASMDVDHQTLVMMAERTSNGVVVTNADGKVLWVNKGFERLSGYSLAECRGQVPGRLLQCEQTDASEVARLRDTLLRGAPFQGELLNRSRDGRDYWVQLDIQPLRDVEGVLHGFMALEQDVTAQHQTAEALRQARDAAEAANRAKSAFLSAMSHEIRTPMNGVLGMAELLMHTRLDTEQAEALRTVVESARSLVAVVDDILDFSKIEADHVRLQSLAFSPRELLHQVADGLALAAVEKGVLLSVDVDASVPPQLLGDPTRCRQVLATLAAQAITLSSRRGESQPRWGLVRVHWGLGEAGFQCIRISDNGVGLSAELRSLWTEDLPIDVLVGRPSSGGGLGPVIGRRLVDLMGGRLSLVSGEGAGTQIQCQLPLARAPQPPEASQAVHPTHAADAQSPGGSDARPLAGVRVGLVEPVPRLLPEVQRWLTALGAHCVGEDAADGELPSVLLRLGQPAGPLPEVAREPGPRVLWLGIGTSTPRMVDENQAVLGTLRREALQEAVAVLAGQVALGQQVARVSVLSRAAGGGVSRQTVLVAEDDPISQRVVEKQLALLGYPVVLTPNGAAALARWRQGDCALLLSDIHMPEMDGLELVRHVRAEEARSGSPRRPVLALTANAVKGEDLKAFAAGFDAYLTKPLSVSLLGDALRRWMPAEVPADSTDPALPLFDLEALQAVVGSDPAVALELLQAFVPTLDEQAQELADALARHDRAQAAALAHKLKSSARSVGALALGAFCAQLEERQAGEDEDWMNGQLQRLGALRAATTARVRQAMELELGTAG